MGCCGCTLRTSAIIAAVWGIIQCLVGIIGGIVTAVQINSDILIYLKYRVDTVLDAFFGGWQAIHDICVAHIVFNVIWIMSCIVLIVAIKKENAALHRQWTAVTVCVLLSDAIMFIVVCTKITNLYLGLSPTPNDIFQNKYLMFLLSTLSRFGIIGLACNISLAIYVIQRATEITNGPLQPATHMMVIGQTGQVFQPMQTTIVIPGQPGQPGFQGYASQPTGYSQYTGGQPSSLPYVPQSTGADLPEKR